MTAHPEKRVAQVEVVSCQSQVLEEVVRIGLRDIGAIEVEAKKHDAGPSRDQEVDLADNALPHED